MKRIFVFLILSLLIVHAGNIWAVEVDVLGGVDIHGFISQGYLKSSDNNYLTNDSEDGTFAFNEIGINFSKQLTDQLRIGLQLFSHDLGEIGNNDIILDWAFADYRWKDWLGLRVGKLKIPQGFYNETRDIDSLRTFILLPSSVYLETFREPMVSMIGFGAYGEVPLGMIGSLSYQLLIGTQDINEDSGTARASEGAASGGGIYLDIDEFDVGDKYVGSLIWRTPLEGLRLGGSFHSTPMTIDSHLAAPFVMGPMTLANAGDRSVSEMRMKAFVLSVEYTWEDLVIATEYSHQKIDKTDTINSTAFGPFPVPYPRSSETSSEGYYVSASYRFAGWLEMGAYYSDYTLDKDDTNGSTYDPYYKAWNKDKCLTARFDINEYWLVKLEGHHIDGVGFLNNLDNTDWERKWWLFAAKVSFIF